MKPLSWLDALRDAGPLGRREGDEDWARFGDAEAVRDLGGEPMEFREAARPLARLLNVGFVRRLGERDWLRDLLDTELLRDGRRVGTYASPLLCFAREEAVVRSHTGLEGEAPRREFFQLFPPW